MYCAGGSDATHRRLKSEEADGGIPSRTFSIVVRVPMDRRRATGGYDAENTLRLAVSSANKDVHRRDERKPHNQNTWLPTFEDTQ